MSNMLEKQNTNLSVAWAGAFLALMEPGLTEITPLIVTVTGMNAGIAQENTEIKEALDRSLTVRSY